MALRRWPVWVWFALANGLFLAAAAGAASWVYMHGNPFKKAEPDPALAISYAPTLPSSPSPGPPANSGTRPATAANPDATLTVEQVIRKVDDGILLIQCKNSAGRPVGLGSGFIINDEGLVATSFHVLRSASSADVLTRDGKLYPIKGVRAWDGEGDLAILELQDKPDLFEILKLCGDGRRIPASEVIAIGHPQGFRFSTTTGVISGVHKTDSLPEPYRSFIRAPKNYVWIQTSAAISGGNSGGPLLNRAGEVIGINTWVAGGQNLGFAADVRHLIALIGRLQPDAISLAELTGPEEKLTTLLENFQNQRLYFAQQLAEAKDETARNELIESRHPAIDCLPKLFEFADQYRGKPVAFSALKACCEIAALEECPQSCDKSMKQAADRLVEDHRNESRLTSILLRLGRSTLPEVPRFGERLAQESKEPAIQAASWLMVALSLRSSATEKEPNHGPIIAALERLAENFAGVRLEGTLVSEIAEPLLYTLKHLSIGCVPPDIDGADQEGKSMRLSDFRGKVVVLDFWADWCPHCVNMYPLERKLVEQYAGQPFVLVGVNCDEPARFRRVLAQKLVTWKNWQDGPNGPINEQWKIQSFPTLYVLDHEGKIRYVNVRDEDLEKAVKELVAKAPGYSPVLAQTNADAPKAGAAEAPSLPDNIPQLEPELREWTSRDGRKAKFRFLGLDGDRVKLRRESGKELTAPLDTFSDEDQAWVRQQQTK